MLYGLYLSAAGLQAQETRQSVIANNLANANTTGFKRDLALIQARANAAHEEPSMMRYRSGILGNQGGGVVLRGGGVDLSQGTLQSTGVSTDFAIDGPGFFVLQGNDSGPATLTRDGRFRINPDGTLVGATSGKPVLDNAGQTIKLNPSLPVLADSAGHISQSDGAGAGEGGGTATGQQLKIVDVSDPRHVLKLGGNLMTVDDPKNLVPSGPQTIIRQQMLENSSVDPVVEMVHMMEGQRAFDANARMISYQDQTLQQINSIGRIA